MPGNKVILYDLPSSGRCRSWSLNVWKTRLILNFKNVPYETKWVPLSRVGETIKALCNFPRYLLSYLFLTSHCRGLEPNAPGAAFQPHTVPTVLLPDEKRTPVMNSIHIAPKLEEFYPSPSLQLDTNVHIEAQEIIDQIIMPVMLCWLPKIAKTVMTDEDKTWFYETRVPEVGLPLKEEEELPSDEHWEAAKPGFEKLVALLERNDKGPFILGERVSYGDFVIVAVVKMFESMGEEELGRWLKWKAVRKLWETCGDWMVRDD